MASRKLRLTVAHNGDAGLVPELAGVGSVESVFGKMTMDLVGGGRNSYVLADIDFGKMKRLVTQAHENDLKYIYLLNAPCLSNWETTRDFNDRLFTLIGTLVDIGVDGFVVALPYMLDLIKRHFPNTMVSVSTFAIVNSIKKARVWEDKGADRIILQQDLNRDFKLLEKIRKAVSCELELFANNMCMDQCPYPPFHAAFNAHGSSSADGKKGFGLDYCGFNCALRRLENPVEFIRGRFIRPEDLHLYEDIGIDVFKLADRVKPTPWLVGAARAYDAHRFDGNLAELIGYPYLRGDRDTVLSKPSSWLLRPDYIHLDVVKEMAALGAAQTIVTIDNRKLDGFCEYFTRHDCRNAICGVECKHCERYAKKAVTVDRALAAERIEHNRRIIEMMVDRTAFASEPLLKRASIKTIKATASAFSYSKRQILKMRRNPTPTA